MSTYAARAQLGAALLDEDEPGWVDKIDLGTLDIANDQTCALTQIYGNFSLGYRTHRLPSFEVAAEYGFITHGFPLILDEQKKKRAIAADYAGLTNAWKALILERRAPPVPLPLAA